MPQKPLNSLKFTIFPHLGAKRGPGGAPARQTMKTAVKSIVSGWYLGWFSGVWGLKCPKNHIFPHFNGFRGKSIKFIKIHQFSPFGRPKGAWGGPGAPDHENSSNNNHFGGVFGVPERQKGGKYHRNRFLSVFCENHKISTKTQFLWFLVEIL